MENDVSHLLELLNLVLSVVLMLLMKLTLPSGYAIDAEEFEGTSRNFDLSSIGDKFGRGSPETYVVFESVDELFGELHRINVDQSVFIPTKIWQRVQPLSMAGVSL